MICRIERKGLRYQAVVIQEGRPRVTTRITTLTKRGAEKVLREEGCGGLGRAGRRGLGFPVYWFIDRAHRAMPKKRRHRRRH